MLGVIGILLVVGGTILAIAAPKGQETQGLFGLGWAMFGGFLLIGIPFTNFGKWDGFDKRYKPPKRKIKETPELNRLSLAVRVTGSLCLLLGTGGCAFDLSIDVGNLGPTPIGVLLVVAGLCLWFLWFVAAGFNRDWLQGESAGP